MGAGWVAWQKTHLTATPDSIPSEPIKPAAVTVNKSAGPIPSETTPAKPATAGSGQTIPPPAVASKLPTVSSAPAAIAPPTAPTPPAKPKTLEKPEVAVVKPEPPKPETSKPEVPKPKVAAVTPETPKSVAPKPEATLPKPEIPKPEIAAAKPETSKVETPKPVVAAVKPEAPKPEMAKVEPPKPVAVAPPPPLEVTRPAQPALTPVSEAMLQEAATKSATALNATTPAASKLAVISEAGRYSAEVEQFFKDHPSLGASDPEASSGKVVVLPGGEDAKVFRMITRSCPEGALLYFHTNNGKILLDWPLFKQSHDKTYDKFVTNPNNAVAPQWFSALCRRTHTTALKGTAKDQWIALDAQGSLATIGAAVVYVDKNSPVGRYLDQKLTWDRIYLVNLRLGKKILEGQSVNVILECEEAKP